MLPEMAKINTGNTKHYQSRKLEFPYTTGECKSVQLLWKAVWQHLVKLKNCYTHTYTYIYTYIL